MTRRMLALFASLAVACAGGEGDSGTPDAPVSGTPDAPDGVTPDAAPPDAGTPDAASTPDAGTGALGQACNATTPCPSSAPLCVRPQGSQNGMCTLICDDDFMFTTNAASQPTSLPGGAADSACVAAYSGGVGVAGCYAILLNTLDPPAPAGLAANTPYTADVSCAIRCGAAGACPTGLSCTTNQYCER